jgi:hypothetical protein
MSSAKGFDVSVVDAESFRFPTDRGDRPNGSVLPQGGTEDPVLSLAYDVMLKESA